MATRSPFSACAFAPKPRRLVLVSFILIIISGEANLNVGGLLRVETALSNGAAFPYRALACYPDDLTDAERAEIIRATGALPPALLAPPNARFYADQIV